MEIVFLLAVVSMIVCGRLGYIVGRTRRQESLGLLLGVILGPLGVLIAALLPEGKEGSPYTGSRLPNGQQSRTSYRYSSKAYREKAEERSEAKRNQEIGNWLNHIDESKENLR